MKIIRYISTVLSLFTEFTTMWSRVVERGDYPKCGRSAEVLRDFLYRHSGGVSKDPIRHCDCEERQRD
jgi:hypothetical protein